MYSLPIQVLEDKIQIRGLGIFLIERYFYAENESELF